MSKEAKLTRGIGARIAHNTPCISSKDALIDRILTSATNAKQKKKTKIAQHKDLSARDTFGEENSSEVIQELRIQFSCTSVALFLLDIFLHLYCLLLIRN